MSFFFFFISIGKRKVEILSLSLFFLFFIYGLLLLEWRAGVLCELSLEIDLKN